MKIIKFLLKKIFCSAFLLFGYNLIAVSFNMLIPINYYTVSIVSLLGSSGIVSLAIFKYFFL